MSTGFIRPFSLPIKTSRPSICRAPSSAPKVSRFKMSYLQADIDHIALDCQSDPLALLSFYVDVLGFEPYRVEEFKTGKAPFPSVRLSPLSIIDFFASKSPSAKGLDHANHFCFSIQKDAFEQLQSRLKEHQVQVLDGPAKRSGARGDGTSIYIKDPEENMLEFRYY